MKYWAKNNHHGFDESIYLAVLCDGRQILQTLPVYYRQKWPIKLFDSMNSEKKCPGCLFLLTRKIMRENILKRMYCNSGAAFNIWQFSQNHYEPLRLPQNSIRRFSNGDLFKWISEHKGILEKLKKANKNSCKIPTHEDVLRINSHVALSGTLPTWSHKNC